MCRYSHAKGDIATWKKGTVLKFGLLVVFGLLAVVGVGVKTYYRLRRRMVLRAVQGDLVKSASAVSARISVEGRQFHGFRPGYSTRTWLEMKLTTQQFVVVTNRGVLFDISADGERGRIGSIRCTGPGRIVFEGERGELNGKPTRYRVEATMPTASEWVRALDGFADETVNAPF